MSAGLTEAFKTWYLYARYWDQTGTSHCSRIYSRQDVGKQSGVARNLLWNSGEGLFQPALAFVSTKNTGSFTHIVDGSEQGLVRSGQGSEECSTICRVGNRLGSTGKRGQVGGTAKKSRARELAYSYIALLFLTTHLRASMTAPM